MKEALVALLCSALALTLGACASGPTKVESRRKPRIYYLPSRPEVPKEPARAPLPRVSPSDQDGPPTAGEIPPNLEKIADPVPTMEPISSSGNSPTYEVYGKTYKVMNTARGYHELGRASWYGKKFHGRKTSSGEPYNMFALTGAHRSLPIPTYVRVTNLDNGRSCIVRVNDRGPFHSDRIIDLSYAAAVKLDMLSHGEIPVRVESILPRQQLTRTDTRYLQVGAFADPITAVSLRENLRQEGVDQVEIRSETRDATPWHRVLVGPFEDSDSFETARQLLQAQQYPATPVAD